jgi:hypothetical protein
MKISPTFKIWFIAAAIVIPLSFVGLGLKMAFADEAPPLEVSRHGEAIEANQPEISKEKAIIAEHQKRLDALKSDNAYHVGGMEAFGWTYDWNTKKPVKLEVPLE